MGCDARRSFVMPGSAPHPTLSRKGAGLGKASVDLGRRGRHATAMRFRPATAADIPALHALIEAAYRGDAARAGWTHEADLLDGQRTDPGQLAALVAQPRHAMLLAEDDRGALGCVLVADKDGAGYLGVLAIRPDAQGGGHGAALIGAAEAYAREVFGLADIRMTVIRQRPELVAYYERRGYTQTGVTEPFPYGDAGFGLPRRDDLVMVVMAKRLR